MATREAVVREATAGDFDAVEALWRELDELHAQLQPDFFRALAQPHRARAELERIVRAPDEVVLVADDGAVVGLVHVQVFDTPPIPLMMPRRRAHLDSLVVVPAARRRGIGRRLVELASIWARTRGAEEVVLTVWAGNEAAERFYERLGFAPVSRVLGRRL